MEDEKHKNKRQPRQLILEDNGSVDQSVDLLLTNKGIFTLRDVLQKFENQKFHVELEGNTSKKKIWLFSM